MRAHKSWPSWLVLAWLLGALPAQAQTAEENAGPSLEDAGVDAAVPDDAALPVDDVGIVEDAGPPVLVPDEEHAALPPEHQPQLTLTLTPDSISTGDVVHAELLVVVPEGDDVNLPRQPYAPFELIDQGLTEMTANGRRTFTYRLDFLALEPGDLTLPALTVRVITPDGLVGTAQTEPQVVHVESLIANEPDAQPRPPTDPVVVMEDDYTLAWIGGALGLMALTALITWLIARWLRNRPKLLAPPPPPRPAWEIAMAKLRAARTDVTAAMAEGAQSRVIDAASDALREYLGRRFDFNGLESTSDEVIAHLRTQHLSGVTLPEIQTLLGDCDLVKFAKFQPSKEDCERILSESERMVQRTMHGPVAVAVPAPAANAPMERTKASVTTTMATTKMMGTEGAAALPIASAPVQSDAPYPTTNPPPPPGDDLDASIAPLPDITELSRSFHIEVKQETDELAQRIPVTPVPPPPPADDEPVEGSEDAIWDALDAAVETDALVIGHVLALREEGYLVRLGEGVHAVLPEAQLGSLAGDGLVGSKRAFRILSLNTTKKRVVLTHREISEAQETELLARATNPAFTLGKPVTPVDGGAT